MMRRSLALAGLLLLAGTLLADVKIAGETDVPLYRAVRLEAVGDIKDAWVVWDVSSEENVDIVVEEGGRFYFIAPEGPYNVKLRVLREVGGKKSQEVARKTVTVGKRVPPPEPGPHPGPDPAPVVKAWVVIVEQTSEAKAE